MCRCAAQSLDEHTAGGCNGGTAEHLYKRASDDVQDLEEAEALAKRNAGLVHAITYQEATAGIFQPPPPDEQATSDLAGTLCYHGG